MSKDQNKTKRIGIRLSSILFRKLIAICKVTGKSKTTIIEELILSEYEKNKKYEEWYYHNLDKEV